MATNPKSDDVCRIKTNDELSAKFIANIQCFVESYSLIISGAMAATNAHATLSPNSAYRKVLVPFNEEGKTRFSVRGEEGEIDKSNNIIYDPNDITITGGAATMIYENNYKDLGIESIKRKTLDIDMVWWPRVSGPKMSDYAIVSQSEIIRQFALTVKNNIQKKFNNIIGKECDIEDVKYIIKNVLICDNFETTYVYGAHQMQIILELNTGDYISLIDFSIYDSASSQKMGTTDQRLMQKKTKSGFVNMIRLMQEDPIYMTSEKVSDVKQSLNNAAKYSKYYSNNINKAIKLNGIQINIPILERLKEQQEFVVANIKNTNKNIKTSVYEDRLRYIRDVLDTLSTKKSSLLGKTPMPQQLPPRQYQQRLIIQQIYTDATGQYFGLIYDALTREQYYSLLSYDYPSKQYIIKDRLPVYQPPPQQYYSHPEYQQQYYSHPQYQQQQRSQYQQQPLYPLQDNIQYIKEELIKMPSKNGDKYLRKKIYYSSGDTIIKVDEIPIEKREYDIALEKQLKRKGKRRWGGSQTYKISKKHKGQTRKKVVGYANILSLDGKQILFKTPINLI